MVPLNGPSDLVEGQSAHYECRIEPYPDSTLKLEWFHNNKPILTGGYFIFKFPITIQIELVGLDNNKLK